MTQEKARRTPEAWPGTPNACGQTSGDTCGRVGDGAGRDLTCSSASAAGIPYFTLQLEG